MTYQDTSTDTSQPRTPCAIRIRCQTDCLRSRRDVTNMGAIRTSAGKFIERFGEKAADEARRRAEELLTAQNYPARVRWQLISREVEALLSAQSA